MQNGCEQGPRNARPEEFNEIVDLTEKAYSTPRSIYSDLAAPDNFKYENSYIIREGGKIASLVRMFPVVAVVNACEIPVAGIGGVATHPECRGKGYMGKLLDYAAREMKARDIPLSILWGYTPRYRHFGWERGGQQLEVLVQPQTVKQIKVSSSFAIDGYEERKHLERLMALHERETFRVKRTRAEYAEYFRRPQYQIWVGHEDDNWSYLILRENAVIEFGGSPAMVCELIAALFLLQRGPGLRVYCPCVDSETTRMLLRVAQEWKIMPLGMLKIIDLKKVLTIFRPELRKRMQFYGVAKGATVTLCMTDSRQTTTLTVGDDVEISEESTGAVLALSDIEMVRLIFGMPIERFGGNERQQRLLRALFPLNVYYWLPDDV